MCVKFAGTIFQACSKANCRGREYGNSDLMKVLKAKIRAAIAKTAGRPFRYNKMLQEAEIISFDVFDTLIFRTAAVPEDVFDAIPYPSFKSRRIEAERAARRESGREEVALNDIYQVFFEKYPAGNMPGRKPDKLNPDPEELKDAEIKAELSACYANPEALGFYKELQERRKRIIIVSDMYLPASVIAAILHNAGFTGYERLFVSSEYGLTKRSGRLFWEVQREMGTANIVHIGDNFISDYCKAWKMGLKGYLYKPCREVRN